MCGTLVVLLVRVLLLAVAVVFVFDCWSVMVFLRFGLIRLEHINAVFDCYPCGSSLYACRQLGPVLPCLMKISSSSLLPSFVFYMRSVLYNVANDEYLVFPFFFFPFSFWSFFEVSSFLPSPLMCYVIMLCNIPILNMLMSSSSVCTVPWMMRLPILQLSLADMI